jgi:glycine dehydrogenase subunit 2
LLPFLPIPVVGREESARQAHYRWLTENDMPQSIGRLSAFMGNAGVLLRAYVYMRMVGKDGMKRIAEFATLNANYLQARLREAGFELAFPSRRASHEFIITLKNEAKTLHVNTMDFAKALLDRNIHAPTTYFPLLVPECLLIEPTESESKQALDGFVAAMIEIAQEARVNPERTRGAPYTTPVRRLDVATAPRQLDLAWKAASE